MLPNSDCLLVRHHPDNAANPGHGVHLLMPDQELGGGSSLDGSHGGLLAVAAKFGVVLVGGEKCLNIIRTEDVEDQDKISSKQERTQENSNFDKKVCLFCPMLVKCNYKFFIVAVGDLVNLFV